VTQKRGRRKASEYNAYKKKLLEQGETKRKRRSSVETKASLRSSVVGSADRRKLAAIDKPHSERELLAAKMKELDPAIALLITEKVDDLAAVEAKVKVVTTAHVIAGPPAVLQAGFLQEAKRQASTNVLHVEAKDKATAGGE
jgi:hypothetical protein